jgi:O-antigen/teichoic acid export membrane protein
MSDAIQGKRWNEVRVMYNLSSRYLLLIGGLFFLGINLSVYDLLTLLPLEYMVGLNVVYILSIGTLFNMATGSNTSVLFYSEHYKVGIVMLLALIVMAFCTNLIFIPLWGLEGAAFATVLSLFLFNLLKFGYIWRYMHMQPFDVNSFKNMGLIAVCMTLYFVPFSSNSAIITIILRSVVITVVYVLGAYVLRLAPELFQGARVKLFGK